MTTTLSQEGRIVIPKTVRQRLGLKPGDRFDVASLGSDTIRLKRLANRRKASLGPHLLSCPVEIPIPHRSASRLRAFRLRRFR